MPFRFFLWLLGCFWVTFCLRVAAGTLGATYTIDLGCVKIHTIATLGWNSAKIDKLILSAAKTNSSGQLKPNSYFFKLHCR